MKLTSDNTKHILLQSVWHGYCQALKHIVMYLCYTSSRLHMDLTLKTTTHW